MTENAEPGRTSGQEIAAIAFDVELELGRVEALGDDPATTLAALPQEPAEIGYYEAELRSLGSAVGIEDPASG